MENDQLELHFTDDDIVSTEGGVVTKDVVMKISHEHLVQALWSYLVAYGYWPFANAVMVDADFGIDVNDEGSVDVIVTIEEEVAN